MNTVTSGDGRKWIHTPSTLFEGGDIAGKAGTVADLDACFDRCLTIYECISVAYEHSTNNCSPKSINQNSNGVLKTDSKTDFYQKITQEKKNKFSIDTSVTQNIEVYAYARKKGHIEFGISPMISIRVGCAPDLVVVEPGINNLKFGYSKSLNYTEEKVNIKEYFSFKPTQLCSEATYQIKMMKKEVPESRFKVKGKVLSIFTSMAFE